MKQVDFWARDFSIAAKACQKKHPDTVKETLLMADEICRNSFIFRGHWEMERTHVPVDFGDTINWEHEQDGDNEWTFAFNRHSFLVVLGQAWRYTGDARYSGAAARLWEDWIDNAPLTPQSKKTSWRSIETGLRCESWLRALALFKGSAVPNLALQEKIETSLRVHAGWLLEANGTFQAISNWGVLQDHGLLLLGLAFDEKEWCATASQRLSEQLHHQVMADGTHWEQSPLYHCEVLHCCLNALLATQRCGYSLPSAFIEKTHAMATALAYMLRPDGKLVCQSDSDEIDARDLLALGAVLFEDGELKAYANGVMYEENYWDFADFADKYAKIPISPCRGSVQLPHSGNTMLWDGSGKDAGFVHFHCGSLGSGHGHADLLHVDLVQNGETVLADSGRFTYVDSPMRKYLKSPAGHNTTCVDGVDFTQYVDSWLYGPIAEPLKGSAMFTADIDYVDGAHLGYQSLGVLPRRRVLRLGSGLWLLWDSFAVFGKEGNAHSYETFFHFGQDGQASVDDAGKIEYSGVLCNASVRMCATHPLALDITKQPLSREYSLLEKSDCLTARHSATGFSSVATAIASDQASAKMPSLQMRWLEVRLQTRDIVLPPKQAQAVEILCGADRWVVLVCHNEVISAVDLLGAGGHRGYGKVLVFGPGCEDGRCLAW